MSIALRLAACTAIAGVFFAITARADETSRQSKPLAAARGEYASAIKKARNTLHSHFDKVGDTVRKSNIKPDERIKLIDALRTEKEQFALKGLCPFSAPMRPYLIEYLKAMQTANATLKRKYDTAISDRIKAKDDDGAKKLRTEYQQTVSRQLIANWDCTDGKQQFPIKLYADGTFESTLWGGPQLIWSFDGDTLVVNAANANAFGQKDLISRCTLSPDGTTFSAEQNTKWRFTGKRHVDAKEHQ